MGIMNLVEEAAGAFAADKALEAVDPNAGFLAKAAAGVAGFEGVSKIQAYMDGDSSTDGSTGSSETDDTSAQD